MKRLLVAAAAATILSGSAYAADIVVVPPAPPIVVPPAPPATKSLYVSVFGGLYWQQDADIVALTNPPEFTVGTDRGYRLGGAIGMQFTPMLGAEIEGTYATADICCAIINDTPILVDPGASSNLFSIMGNLTIGHSFGKVRPYVALGAGAINLGVNVPAGMFAVDEVVDRDWTWGLQVLAGVDFALSDTVSIGARYRLQHVGPTLFVDGGGDDVNVSGFHTHSLEAVLTFHF